MIMGAQLLLWPVPFEQRIMSPGCVTQTYMSSSCDATFVCSLVQPEIIIIVSWCEVLAAIYIA